MNEITIQDHYANCEGVAPGHGSSSSIKISIHVEA